MKKSSLKNNSLKKPQEIDFALGAFLGLIFFLLVYGIATLDVTYDSWIYRGYIEDDIIQRYAGWLYYRSSSWSFPVVTVAENLAVPYGTSISFTDSIPLVAVFCKILSPILPATFQYFGWVNLFNCALQGGFAMLLLRHFAVSRGYAAVSAVFFITAPIFVERIFRHDGLAAQWILLAALLFYFKARKSKKISWGFAILCVLSVGIHMYFLPMVYALFLAAVLEHMGKGKSWKQPVVCFGLSFVGVLGMAYVCGMLTRGGGGVSMGFGVYSMNLNAPFSPSSLDLFSTTGEQVWSRIIPVQQKNYHQYDGFNYWGMGILLGVVVMGIYGAVKGILMIKRKDKARWQRIKNFVKGHVWLVLVCACLAIFAPSHIVWAGNTLLWEIPLPGKIKALCSVFRASGRMFWPITYLAMLSVLLWIWHVLKNRWRTVAVCILLAVQLFDTSGALLQKHQYFAVKPQEEASLYTSNEWRFFMENYDNIVFLNNIFDYRLAAGIIRYNTDVKTNLIVANRGDFPIIEVTQAETRDFLIEKNEIPEGTLYITDDDDFFYAVLTAIHPNAKGYKLGDYYVIGLPQPGCPVLPEKP